MTSYGLLSTGFVPQTTSVIRSEIEENLRTNFHRSIPLGDHTLLGHLIAIFSERLGLVWEVLEAVYSAGDPDAATGASLEVLCLLSATFRRNVSASLVIETLCGDDGTLVVHDSIISVTSTGKQFATMTDAIIVALDAWSASSAYVAGDRVTNAARCYVCITAGLTAGSGGPTTTSSDITDNTVHWKYLGEGAGAVDVVCASLDSGEVVAVAGDLTTIENPLGGWNTAVNLQDAQAGLDLMEDEELRLLREAQLSQPGTGPADAIKASLLALDGVTSVTVFYNNTGLTVSGMPPKSVECLVLGGTDQDIWDCLWNNVSAGIETVGTEAGTALDSSGNPQPMKFSRPAVLTVWVEVTLTKNPKTYPGDDAVKAAIVKWGSGRGTEYDVVSAGVLSAAFIQGVINIPSMPLIGLTNPPVSSALIAVTPRQLAVYDTSRVTVLSSDATP